MAQICEAFRELWEQKALIVGLAANMATNMTYLSLLIYAPLVYQAEYADTQENKDYISSRIALLYLISVIATLPICILLGYVSDRIKVYVILFLWNII